MNISSSMKGIVCLSAACLLCSFADAKTAKDKKDKGRFVSQPVNIDGKDTEWPSPYPNYNSKAGIAYLVANDKENLYITVKVNNEQIQRKVLMGGMTVWIDTLGKKQENIAIQYPLKNAGDFKPREKSSNDSEYGMERPPMQDSTAHNRPSDRPVPKDYKLTGLKSCDGDFSPLKGNSCGIQVAMGWGDYNELIWEASIPLSLIYPELKTNNVSPKGAFSVGFEIGGVSMPSRPSGGRPQPPGGGQVMTGGGMQGGGMQGGGGMPPGGGMGGMQSGGGPGPDGGNKQENATDISQTTTTWTKSFIAGF